jgi:hypothetical protein
MSFSLAKMDFPTQDESLLALTGGSERASMRWDLAKHLACMPRGNVLGSLSLVSFVVIYLLPHSYNDRVLFNQCLITAKVS